MTFQECRRNTGFMEQTYQHLQACPRAHTYVCACVEGNEKGLRPREFSLVTVAVKNPVAGAVKAQGIMKQVIALPSLTDKAQGSSF